MAKQKSDLFWGIVLAAIVSIGMPLTLIAIQIGSDIAKHGWPQ